MTDTGRRLAAACRELADWVKSATVARRIQLVPHPDDEATIGKYEQLHGLRPGSAARVFGATEGILYSIIAEPGGPVVFLPEQSRYLRAGECGAPADA